MPRKTHALGAHGALVVGDGARLGSTNGFSSIVTSDIMSGCPHPTPIFTTTNLTG
jgi:hypothetical protein